VEGVEFQGVTKFTDPSWWKSWNFSGSQNLLTPVGGRRGISAGHKIYWPWLVEVVEFYRVTKFTDTFMALVFAHKLVVGGMDGTGQYRCSMEV
jgi:hypothetical protein